MNSKKGYKTADLVMQKMPFLVKAVCACIRHPLLDAVSSYLDNMAHQIHRELGDNGIYLSVCMAPADESEKYGPPVGRRAG